MQGSSSNEKNVNKLFASASHVWANNKTECGNECFRLKPSGHFKCYPLDLFVPKGKNKWTFVMFEKNSNDNIYLNFAN